MLKHRYSFKGFIVSEGAHDIAFFLHLITRDVMSAKRTSRVTENGKIVAEWFIKVDRITPNDRTERPAAPAW